MLTFPQIRALLAGFICMLIYGSAYTYGTLVPYVASYLYYSGDHEITISTMAVLLIVSIMVLNFGMPLTNIKALAFSNRITSMIALAGVCGSIFAISFCSKFIWYVILYGIVFGLFIGFGYLAPVKNCYQYIPNRKGLCSGVCILGYGISSLLFNMILLQLINPNNESTINIDGKNLFPQYVAGNVPYALRIMSGIYLAIGIVGIALMIPPQKKSQLLQNQANEAQTQEYERSILSQKSQVIQVNKKTTKEFLLFLIQKKLPFIILTLTSSIPFGMFIAFNYKQYGLTKIQDDSFLTVIGSTGAIFNGLGRLFWGVMFDKFSFRAISSIINGILLINAIAMPYAVLNQYIFLILVAATYFAYGGNYSIYPTLTMRIFGAETGGKVYYLVFSGFSFGTVEFIIGCLIQWLSRLFFVSNDDKYSGFTICFYIFAAFNLLAILLSIFLKYDIMSENQKN